MTEYKRKLTTEEEEKVLRKMRTVVSKKLGCKCLKDTDNGCACYVQGTLFMLVNEEEVNKILKNLEIDLSK